MNNYSHKGRLLKQHRQIHAITAQTLMRRATVLGAGEDKGQTHGWATPEPMLSTLYEYTPAIPNWAHSSLSFLLPQLEKWYSVSVFEGSQALPDKEGFTILFSDFSPFPQGRERIPPCSAVAYFSKKNKMRHCLHIPSKGLGMILYLVRSLQKSWWGDRLWEWNRRGKNEGRKGVGD